MKKRILLIVFFIIAAGLLLFSLEKIAFSGSSLSSKAKTPDPQSRKKPKYDYMSTFLSRNTQPLGLKENVALKKLLQQSTIKWTIRSSKRHILD